MPIGVLVALVAPIAAAPASAAGRFVAPGRNRFLATVVPFLNKLAR